MGRYGYGMEAGRGIPAWGDMNTVIESKWVVYKDIYTCRDVSLFGFMYTAGDT